ncbi:MAG: hypothetical protein ACKVJK_24320 [Methylophagaceae bacterium]
MNKQDIIKKLANPRLDDYERESLGQLLHYMNAEGVNNTSSNNNNTNNSHKRTSDKRTSSNYKGNKHTR